MTRALYAQCLLVALLLLWASLTSADITSNMVGQWKFNEGTGTTPQDSSGNANHGTFVGTPTWSAGKIGPYALSFASNAKVDIGNGSTLNPATGLTLAAWIRMANGTPAATNNLLNKSVADGQVQYGLRVVLTSGIVRGSIAAVNTTATDSASGVIANNTWTHVAITWDQVNAQMYINGTASGSAVAKTGTIADNAQTVLIGCNKDTTPLCFTGDMDDVRIYNRGLSAGDIAELFAFTDSAHRRIIFMHWKERKPWLKLQRILLHAFLPSFR